MTIDALASQSQYLDHVMPVWDALTGKGTLHAGTQLLPPGNPTLVASYVDSRRAMRRSVIYMEHGVGQTYRPNHPSYAGGRNKGHVGLFLSPSERVANINRAAYPNAEHEVIGCPLLDKWIGHKPKNREPVISMAFHWNALSVAPEARSAFPYYSEAIPKLPYKLLGHGHPRAMKRLIPFYERNGIEWTDSFDEVMDRADVLVFDNTSVGFMFAATDRPVVLLDAPWYQKAWGGRFWDWADVGVRISEPADLERAIASALVDTQAQRYRRQAISREIFGILDGKASQRAALAIEAWAGQGMRAAA